MAFRETDPASVTCEAGNTPRDPRPMITKLLEIEAIAAGERTLLQTEALELWQGELGDPDDRAEVVDRFLKEGGPLSRFVKFLQRCERTDFAIELSAVAVAAGSAVTRLAETKLVPIERKSK